MEIQFPRRSTVRAGGVYVALLEDDMAIADMYGLALTTAGFNVAAFPDPTLFFTALDVRIPDVLVLDWRLPRMSGREVLDLLRKDARTDKLRVVVLSSVIVNTEMEAAFEAGILAWFDKVKTSPGQLAASLTLLQV